MLGIDACYSNYLLMKTMVRLQVQGFEENDKFSLLSI